MNIENAGRERPSGTAAPGGSRAGDHEPEGALLRRLRRQPHADTLEAIFVPEGRWKCDAMAVDAKGHAERRAFFDGLAASGRIRNSQHMVTNPNIAVNGDRATGTWRMMMVYAGNAPDGTVQFFRILGYYQDDFIYRDGRWYFETLRPMVEDTEAYTVEPSKFATAGLVTADEP